MRKSGLKIILGYLLLTATLCAAVWFIISSARKATGISQTAQTVALQRRASNRLLTNLIDAGTLGENATLKYADDRAVKRFIDGMERIDTALAEMKKLTFDKAQRQRLDSLDHLVWLKREGILNLIETLRIENKRSSGLQKQIAELKSGRKPIEVDTQIPVPIYQKDEEIVIQRRKKGFFRRLGDAFRKAKDDTLQISKATREITHDTTQANVNLSDTIANILSDVQRNIHQDSEAKQKRVSRRSDQLRASSAALSQRIVQLMEDISAEQQRQLQQASDFDREQRTQAAWQMGGWALLTTCIALILLIWVWRDMNRAHHYRIALEEAKLRAEELMERREQLLLTISHDIKAPVNTILGYLSLLRPSTLHAAELNAIDSSAHHLLQLVTALLDYHKLESGGITLNSTPTRIYPLLHQIALAYVPLIRKKGLDFHENLSENTDLCVLTDEFRLRQIVENLLSNAVKYTSQGKIELNADWKDDTLTIEIHDTGCGLSRYDIERVCQPFTRFKGSEGQEGSGLGLSITQKLISLLDGELIIKSQIGLGSTFSVRLRPTPIPSAEREPGISEVRKENISISPPRPFPTNIAILDDDLLQLQLTEAMLRNVTSPDCNIHIFHESDALFAWLSEGQHPDVLFTDIEMPGLTGYDILERVRKIEGLSELSVIATTSHTLIDSSHFCQRGFNAVLFKPFTQNDLRNTLQQSDIIPPNTSPTFQLHDTNSATPSADMISEPRQRFAPLLTFADGDPVAEEAILNQFSKDCREHYESFSAAYATHDKITVCRLAHKMLPTFTLIGSPATDALRLLEGRRTESQWTEADDLPCQTIIGALNDLLTEFH